MGAEGEGRVDTAVGVEPVRLLGRVRALLDKGRNVSDHIPVAHES
jgi:hypothetical protein